MPLSILKGTGRRCVLGPRIERPVPVVGSGGEGASPVSVRAAVWRTAFGGQAIPMGVISGVYKLRNLEDAKTRGIGLVWEHDLAPLAEFLRAAR